MNSNELKELLRTSLESAFSSVSDEHYENTLEKLECDLEKKGYSIEIKQINDGDWNADGKYQNLEDAVSCFTLEGHKFYVGIGQMRSGSYHSDYYYDNPYISYVETEDEYNAPTDVTTFLYKGVNITILSNGGAKTENGDVFSTVELAIDTVNQ